MNEKVTLLPAEEKEAIRQRVKELTATEADEERFIDGILDGKIRKFNVEAIGEAIDYLRALDYYINVDENTAYDELIELAAAGKQAGDRLARLFPEVQCDFKGESVEGI